MKFLLDMARRHDIELHFKRLTDGVRGYSIPDRTIVLDLDLSEERMNWTFCHELAHLLQGHGKPESPVTMQDERDAHHQAQDLLLPPETFRPDTYRFSLTELKKRYPQASWEVIARTRVRHRPGVLTIFDNNKRTVRTAPQPLHFPSELHSLEQEVKQFLNANNPITQRSGDGLQVEGVFIDEGRGVERIILITDSQSE